MSRSFHKEGGSWDMLMGVNVEHFKPACMMITVGRSGCIICSSISHTIREHVQERMNPRYFGQAPLRSKHPCSSTRNRTGRWSCRCGGCRGQRRSRGWKVGRNAPMRSPSDRSKNRYPISTVPPNCVAIGSNCIETN